MSIANSPEQVVLTSQTAATSQNTGTTGMVVPRCVNGCVFTLDVTSAAAAVGDLLDVYVQALVGSEMWVDVVHFTQILGNGGAKRIVAKIGAGLAETTFATSSSLSAGSVRNLLGDQFRVRFDITSSSAPSFTFSVTAQPV